MKSMGDGSNTQGSAQQTWETRQCIYAGTGQQYAGYWAAATGCQAKHRRAPASQVSGAGRQVLDAEQQEAMGSDVT